MIEPITDELYDDDPMYLVGDRVIAYDAHGAIDGIITGLDTRPGGEITAVEVAELGAEPGTARTYPSRNVRRAWEVMEDDEAGEGLDAALREVVGDIAEDIATRFGMSEAEARAEAARDVAAIHGLNDAQVRALAQPPVIR